MGCEVRPGRRDKRAFLTSSLLWGFSLETEYRAGGLLALCIKAKTGLRTLPRAGFSRSLGLSVLLNGD